MLRAAAARSLSRRASSRSSRKSSTQRESRSITYSGHVDTISDWTLSAESHRYPESLQHEPNWNIGPESIEMPTQVHIATVFHDNLHNTLEPETDGLTQQGENDSLHLWPFDFNFTFEPSPRLTPLYLDRVTSSTFESSPVGNTPESQPTPPYSVFTGWTKVTILAVSTFCGFASPLSATIFLPALDDLAADYHVSVSDITLLITVYLIFQAVGPMFVTNFAERAGYRPANIICLAIYVIANIGLAVQNSYAAFLVLRCLQSFGSAVIALRNAVIASIIPPAERGSATAIVGIGLLVGPAFGPLIGAGFTITVGWRWIFWFLAILSGIALVLQTILIPETNRTLVGDGSIPPPEYEWWNRTPLDIKRMYPVDKQDYLRERQQAGLPPRQSPGWPDPRAGLKIILEKDTSIVMLANALNFATLYCVMVSLPNLFVQIYRLTTVEISLCYVGIAGGAGLSLFLSGKLLNWNFRRLAMQRGLPVEKRQAQELRKYPVEKARLQMILPVMAMGVAALVSYGWALRYAAPLGVSIFLLVLIGIAVAYSFNSLNNLLIDLYPTTPSNITAASNLTRCLLGAAGTASVNPLINAMGVGWCYTFIGGLIVVAIPLLLLEMRKGPHWREERFLRLDRIRQCEL